MSYSFDTPKAVTDSYIMDTLISTYAPPFQSLIGWLAPRIIPSKFGAPAIIRGIADPYQDVELDVGWGEMAEQEATKKSQQKNLHSMKDRLKVLELDYEADPMNVSQHIVGHQGVFRDAIEKLFIEGASEKVTIYGISDYPNGTAGTINRPEMAGSITTAGVWTTTANMQTDLINAKVALRSKKFRGQAVLLAPDITMPMMAKQLSNTAVPTQTWIENALGIKTVFSPFVHEAATKDDFNCYLVDENTVHMVLSELRAKSYYVDVQHAYFWDLEIRGNNMMDMLHDSTEYVKGVVMLDARDWSD